MVDRERPRFGRRSRLTPTRNTRVLRSIAGRRGEEVKGSRGIEELLLRCLPLLPAIPSTGTAKRFSDSWHFFVEAQPLGEGIKPVIAVCTAKPHAGDAKRKFFELGWFRMMMPLRRYQVWLRGHPRSVSISEERGGYLSDCAELEIHRASCTREPIPSLVKMFDKWLSTVRWLTPSCRAISWFRAPSATSRAIIRSALVKTSGAACEASGDVDDVRNPIWGFRLVVIANGFSVFVFGKESNTLSCTFRSVLVCRIGLSADGEVETSVNHRSRTLLARPANWDSPEIQKTGHEFNVKQYLRTKSGR